MSIWKTEKHKARGWQQGRPAVVSGLMLLMAGSASAQPVQDMLGKSLLCSMTMECYEQEACTFTQFAFDIPLPDALPGEASLLLPGGPAEGGAANTGGTLYVAAEDEVAVYLLTRTPNSDARLSAHFVDPMQVLTYHGRCELVK